jgi:flagellar basal-body rod modification protein FlgD
MSFDSTLSSLGISTTASTSAKTATSNSSSLNQDDFLTLMTAQLKNQDPFEPVDNTQMVAQMAQFSSLAGITEMSTTLKAIADKLGGASTSDAVSYIGKTVLTEGTTAYGRTAGGIAGAIELDADATDVAITITDTSGQVLKTVSLGAQSKGTISYDWDGVTDAGEDAGAGPFTVKVAATSGTGAVVSRSLVWVPVQSVSTTSGATLLTLPGIGEVPATAVRQIG